MVNKRSRSVPPKPYPDFPLTFHPCGQWCKKIKGKLYYFGTDPDRALQVFLEQRDDLYAGRTPTKTGELTLRLAVNHFLTAKKHLLETGELAERTFGNYKATCSKLIDILGRDRVVAQLRPKDFQQLRSELAKGVGITTLRNNVRVSRMVFRHAEDEELIEGRIRFGKSFNLPSKESIRRDRAAKQREHGLRMFEADELRRILDAAKTPLKAMILLGVNCGFGQSDCSTMTVNVVDQSAKVINFPRPKTGVARTCPIWGETLVAIKESLRQRPEWANEANRNLVFLTKTGLPWVRTGESKSNPGKLIVTDNIGNAFNRLLRSLGLKRQGVSFYALRHTLETIAGETGDQVAVNAIMGHSDQSMAGHYRERIDIDRLIKVVDHVHDWLFKSKDA